MRIIRITDADNNIAYFTDKLGLVSSDHLIFELLVDNKYEMRLLHESECGGLKDANALEIIFNPNIAKNYKNLYAAALTEAFEILWKKARIPKRA